MDSKVGIILASHGTYCEGAKNSLEMIIGKTPLLHCVSVTSTMNISDVEELMLKSYNILMEECEEVLIFTDLLCGTPNNVAVRLMMSTPKITVVSGYNLALLVEVINKRNNSSSTAEELLKDAEVIMKNSLRIMRQEGEI